MPTNKFEILFFSPRLEDEQRYCLDRFCEFVRDFKDTK